MLLFYVLITVYQIEFSEVIFKFHYYLILSGRPHYSKLLVFGLLCLLLFDNLYIAIFHACAPHERIRKMDYIS